jgi:hypothetical protein
MWKIAAVLVLTALAIFMARLVHEAPLFETKTGAALTLENTATNTPLLMYAGIRG